MRKASHALANRQINVLLFTVADATRSSGFDTVAVNIGATSRLLTWADTDSLMKSLEEIRSFYRISFDVDTPAPEVPQRVELRTKRRGVRIRTSSVLTLTPGGN